MFPRIVDTSVSADEVSCMSRASSFPTDSRVWTAERMSRIIPESVVVKSLKERESSPISSSDATSLSIVRSPEPCAIERRDPATVLRGRVIALVNTRLTAATTTSVRIN
jgi:hypothetical protein